jgi:hypothetical protein
MILKMVVKLSLTDDKGSVIKEEEFGKQTIKVV